MALQRIRLQSFAPLPSFRVWFLVPQNAVDVQSLKLAISAQLPALKSWEIQPAQLVLEMDGFELLDECSIGLVREGDIIIINAREPDELKCKANVEQATRTSKRRRLSVSSKESPVASSSSASDTSASDTSASDASTSASSISPFSDSDSEDLKSLLGPKVLSLPSNKRTQSKSISLVVKNQAASRAETISSSAQQPTIPPGMGKASTHSRNKRRKLKRKYAGAQSFSQNESLILPGVSGDKMTSIKAERVLLPASDKSAPVSITPRSTTQLNNKSSGSMESMTPQKLDSNPSSVPSISAYATTFIPPSEREDLPKNLFVTSVEINWRTNQGRTSGRDARKTEPWMVSDDTHAIRLFDPGLHQFSDWTAIETAWEKCKTLSASMDLLPDTIVAWKAFGLDPVTLTPQASMLHLGKVVSVDMRNVVVQPLSRPNTRSATFGRTSMIEDQEPVDHISYPLQEVWSNEWKLISHQ